MAPSTILSVRPYGLSSPPPIPATSWSHQPSSRAQVTQRPTRTAGPLLAAPVPTLPSFTQRRPDRLCLRLEHLRHGPYQPPVLSCRHNRAARGAAMSPGLGSSRCPPQTTLPAVLRPLLARPHARTAPHLNQAGHSLEAGPGPRGPPQVLAQGVHELTQLLGAPQTFLQRRQDNSAKTEPKTPPHSREGSFLRQKWQKRTRTEWLKADDSHAQAGHHTRVCTEGLCGRRELPAWHSGPRHHKIRAQQDSLLVGSVCGVTVLITSPRGQTVVDQRTPLAGEAARA